MKPFPTQRVSLAWLVLALTTLCFALPDASELGLYYDEAFLAQQARGFVEPARAGIHPPSVTTQWIAGRLINLRLRDYFRSLYPATISSVLMIAGLVGYRQLGLTSLNLDSYSLLASCVIVGTVVYLVAMWIVKPDLLLELKTLVFQMVKPRHAQVINDQEIRPS